MLVDVDFWLPILEGIKALIYMGIGAIIERTYRKFNTVYIDEMENRTKKNRCEG